MDPAVLEMRKAMAAKYARAPADQKPKLRICDDCVKPVYNSEICPATGMIHDRDKKRIVGGVIVDGDRTSLTGRDLFEAINAARIKWQGARVTKVRVDNDALAIFQTFVAQTAWRVMRLGVLYGTVEDEGRVTSVHAIYEPEQTANDIKILTWQRDSRIARVDAMSALLGLRRVGLIVTHPARDQSHIVLTAQELLAVTREQSIHGDHCVLLAAGPDPATKQIHCQAWQASQQAVNLFRLGILSEHATDPRLVASTQPLELSQEETDKKTGHKSVIVKEPATVIDTRWLLGFAAVESFVSTVVGNRFIRIVRPGQQSPDFNNLRIFLADPKRNRLPLAEQLADFHVLIFLMETMFDVNQDLPIVIEAIRAKKPLNAFEDLIRERMRLAQEPVAAVPPARQDGIARR